jgi:hypothetical protein
MPENFDNQPLAEKIASVREISQTRLVRFSKLNVDDCKEVYLFDNDHFCGVRIVLGPFKAVWQLDSTVIEFNRGSNSIGQVDLSHSSSRRAA